MNSVLVASRLLAMSWKVVVLHPMRSLRSSTRTSLAESLCRGGTVFKEGDHAKACHYKLKAHIADTDCVTLEVFQLTHLCT